MCCPCGDGPIRRREDADYTHPRPQFYVPCRLLENYQRSVRSATTHRHRRTPRCRQATATRDAATSWTRPSRLPDRSAARRRHPHDAQLELPSQCRDDTALKSPCRCRTGAEPAPPPVAASARSADDDTSDSEHVRCNRHSLHRQRPPKRRLVRGPPPATAPAFIGGQLVAMTVNVCCSRHQFGSRSSMISPEIIEWFSLASKLRAC